MEDVRPISLHMLPTFPYFNKVLCIRGMWVVYFSIHTHHYEMLKVSSYININQNLILVKIKKIASI